MGVDTSHMNPITARRIILSLGVELSAMKLVGHSIPIKHRKDKGEDPSEDVTEFEWNVPVSHHDEGEKSTRDVLDRHDGGQPDPPAPLVQVDGIEEVGSSSQSLTKHTQGKEGLEGEHFKSFKLKLPLVLPFRPK